MYPSCMYKFPIHHTVPQGFLFPLPNKLDEVGLLRAAGLLSRGRSPTYCPLLGLDEPSLPAPRSGHAATIMVL